MADAIDFSKTQRILLFIDLDPFLHLQNPNPYLTSILTSTQILLNTFPSLSSTSLSSFKFFFSSLSPLLSSSKLPNKPSTSLSFDHPSNTFLSLSNSLKSLPSLFSKSEPASFPPRASHFANSLCQILHDYVWDYELEGNSTSIGTLKCTTPSVVRSNLVVLFSPFRKQSKGLAEFIDVDLNDELLLNPDVFCEMFHGIFDTVNDMFVSKDIHLSWVDVKCESESTELKIEIDESDKTLGFLEKGIKSLGWGFCSTDSIILGSALVSFGLIYPMIGISSKRFTCNDYSKKNIVQLSLQISDTSGNPLECKFCDLNIIDLITLPSKKSDDVLQGCEFINSQSKTDDPHKTFWEQFGVGVTKFLIKSIQRYDEPLKYEGRLSDIILVHGFSVESTKDKEVPSLENEFFADRVLKTLILEMGGFWHGKSIPIWPFLMNFLYVKGYWGVVSLSNDNGNSCMGILKPFTVHSAFLFIIDNKSYAQNSGCNIGGLQLFGTTSRKNVVLEEDGRIKNKIKSSFYKNPKWISFRKAAFEQSKMDLKRIYFSNEINNSKKSKFLNCWIKQMKKSLVISDKIKPHQENPKEIEEKSSDQSKQDHENPKETEERLIESHEENELTVSSSFSAGDEFLTEASRIQDEAALDFSSGTVENFFSSLSKKIQEGLESEGVDLGALAECLVNSTIYWLYRKYENDSPRIKPDYTNGRIIADELMELLLLEPKDLPKRHNYTDLSVQASDPKYTGVSSDTTARQYELQILFRMEILRSEIAIDIEESRKQKFVKQICLLLEKIQCCLDGGFFGDWSLDNYVRRLIKNRYSHSLEDIVNNIYKKMDLLPFIEEDEHANPLLYSEDSNHSWRGKLENDEYNKTDESVSADNDPLQTIKNDNIAPQGVIEAQNRRDRARRFRSFTWWVPELKKYWAPKQVKPAKDFSQKVVKRKRNKKTKYDTVCETPMTGNKRSCFRSSTIGEEGLQVFGSNSCNTVSKALFQDDS